MCVDVCGGSKHGAGIPIKRGEGRPLVAMGNGSALLVRGYVPQYQGLVGTIVTIARQEGPRHVMSFAYRSLYNGLSAGLQRQMCFASVRLGLYDTFKNIYQQLIDGNTRSGGLHIGTRVAAGITTGALAVLIAQPTDVVKVRFQAQKRTSGVKRYTSTIAAYRMIGREEGLAGLWKGKVFTLQVGDSMDRQNWSTIQIFAFTQLTILNSPWFSQVLDSDKSCHRAVVLLRRVNWGHGGTFPNMSRNAIVNVSEIVCYDIIKDMILSHNLLDDSVPCHFTSAVIAGAGNGRVVAPGVGNGRVVAPGAGTGQVIAPGGLCTTVMASPVDVVKTRYMNSTQGEYKGAVDCAVRMLVQEGPGAFYKGFTPSFCRLVSWNIVLWITYEQMKKQLLQAKAQEDT
uniref:Mitochondrial uncoupling protein n=1 Tax=Timema bartmani TaxID=61472 RepID=A0A7R9F774_9NEOP|nr:unnamed protein product [Timema bartmani]